jgi:triosephosphate isomerase
MSRTPLIVGNWKMELSHKAELEVVRALKGLLKGTSLQSEVVICPSCPSLAAVVGMLKHTEKLQVGAQAIHWEEKGAFTGAVSVLQVSEFVNWVIAGHSEQRAMWHMTEEMVQAQVDLAQKHGLTPVICIGETAEERRADKTVERVSQQIYHLLGKATRTALSKLVIAYEPIWAIGTGETPDPNDMAATMLLIRKLVAERFDRQLSERLRVIYGGSVTPQNIGTLIDQPGVDGVLVGGASTHPIQFVEIIKAVEATVNNT